VDRGRILAAVAAVLGIFGCGGGGAGGGAAAPVPPAVPVVQPTTFRETSAKWVDANYHRFVTVSDDARDIYTIERDRRFEQRSLVHFHRNNISSAFSVAQTTAISPVADMQFVPSSGQLLVIVGDPWRVDVYRRTPSTGTLVLDQSVPLVNPSGAPIGVSRMVLAPNGAQVHLTSFSENLYSVLSRDGGNRWSITAYGQGVEFFSAVPLITDGGSRAYLVARDGNARIQIYNRNVQTGELTYASSYGAAALPSGDTPIVDSFAEIAISGDEEVVYLLGRFGYQPTLPYGLETRLVVLRRNSTTGELTFVESRDLQVLNEVASIKVGLDSDVVHTAAYWDDPEYDPLSGPGRVHFQTFRRGNDDRLTETQFMDITELLGTLDVAFSNVSQEAFVWDRWNGSAIRRFSIDSEERLGSDSWVGRSGELPQMTGPHQVLTLDGGNQIVVPTPSYKSIFSFGQPGLDLRSKTQTGAGLGGGVGLEMDYFVAKSPDERHLYVYVHGPRILKLTIDQATQTVAASDPPMELAPDPQLVVTDLVFSDDGRFGYLGVQFRVGNDHNDVNAGVVVLERDSAGDLSFIQSVDSGHGRFVNNFPGRARCVLSRDGRYLYLANRHNREMQIYQRDPATGMVTLQEFLVDGDQSIGGWPMEGLMEASSISVSADDRYLYVTADQIYNALNFRSEPTNTTTILVFRRNVASGQLTLVQMLARGTADAAGKPVAEEGGSISGALSADGKLFAVVTHKLNNNSEPIFENGQAIDVYRVDANDGRLSHAQRFASGLAGGGVNGLEFTGDGRLIVINDRVGGVSIYAQQ
jgi:6-phosphogluconolactonase (cycloisomerase 2 family)